MNLDPYTVNVFVAIVTIAAGMSFIADTMLRRENGAGRAWVLAFLSGMLAVVANIIWRSVPDPWLAIAVGNAALVATIAALWLACLRYNGRRILVPGIVVSVVCVLAALAVLVRGPGGGDWAGAPAMFVGVTLFALAVALESRRGELGASNAPLTLTVVFGLVAVYYASRTVLLLVGGPDSPIFTTWTGSATTGTFATVMMIVVLVVATSLRGAQSRREFEDRQQPLRMAADGILSERSFRAVLTSIFGHLGSDRPSFAVIALRIDDLPAVRLAFGDDTVAALRRACRAGAQRHAPGMMLAGEAGADVVLVAFAARSVGDIRQIAGSIQRSVLDDISRQGSVVMPLIGVGVALSETHDHDAAALTTAAIGAARQSALSAEASVVMTG